MPLVKGWSYLDQSSDSIGKLRWFGHISAVLAKTGLIPRLHEMFEEAGLREKYLIFETVEVAVGMLVPLRARYILPYKDDSWQEAESHPGIVAFHGGPRHYVHFQLGLEKPDLVKLSRRLKALGSTPQLPHPVWWQYRMEARDATQPYDLIEDLDEVRIPGLNSSEVWETYIHQGTVGRAVRVNYHRQDKEDPSPVLLWETDEEKEAFQRGMSVLRELVTEAA